MYCVSIGDSGDTDNVEVILSGDASDNSAINDSGTYSLTVGGGGNYLVTPSKEGYTFIPASQKFDNVTSNQTQNFTATIPPSRLLAARGWLPH